MKINAELRGDLLALTMEEERLDSAGALSFKERMRTLVTVHSGRIVLDMDRVEFLDSSGLGALVAAMKMLDSAQKLELARCQPLVSKVLSLTRMDAVFVIHEDLPWAVSQDGDGKDAA